MPLRVWLKITKRAKWQSLADTRKDFPHADLVGVCTVFNIKGNDYRLITKIYYENQKVLVRFVLTHSEYDKGKWKNDCNC
jgi:mRNA interferase HigB